MPWMPASTRTAPPMAAADHRPRRAIPIANTTGVYGGIDRATATIWPRPRPSTLTPVVPAIGSTGSGFDRDPGRCSSYVMTFSNREVATTPIC